MKAVQVTGYGDVDKLEVAEIPVPVPQKGEVLVKVKACAINNTEIWMREGAYGTEEKSGWRPEGVQFPRVPGSDITGEVVEVGADVSETMLGKDVVLFPFTSSGVEGSEHISDDMSFIGSEYDGGYAEYVVWPSELCYDMPLSTYEESAVFSVSGLTAWHMVEQIKAQPSETIVVTGANGGVGSLNVQIASRVFGAKVIAIVGDLALEDRMKELGATHVLSYKSANLAGEILDVNGGPVDSVLDVVGDALFETSLEVLKKGGKFCISGSAGGQKTQLDFRTLYLKHITFYGSVLGTRVEFERMLDAISEGKIKPVIDRTFPLEQASEAQTYFKHSGKLGKIVLLP
ncbi:zinc-binding dehydrogenase [Rossellomorea vietnamensis]|uniref:Zinc-binding dehydrogenase n=1 Tax=Rossellomorea vietnamensis TaxID=218284 RepID=A0ACD4CCG0_9BACI|nr:zinc-binding dehydrogenase [Rossellomorea vietnamensis]UXH46157.1 zinc-binding dehydrogenase [Rossellomorea vietnamensis]WQI97578.1 zinc-binding dehydrogenase [Rossellomorea vietnamensis]WQI97590.1 zinc-binding dehydrogenase [Rossellomorea vietnamensis]WQI97602.1 zinc-binding dehydrogenase [Rossellomorea vietnamensis]